MRTGLWDAPSADGKVQGTVSIPGSKSITNRAFVLAALSGSPSTITRPLLARDTDLMLAAIWALGVGVQHTEDKVTITPAALRGPAAVDCGLAGTVMRFVPPMASLAIGPISFAGDRAARNRPLTQTVRSLRQLGVNIVGDAQGTLPFSILGEGKVPGGTVTIDASESSQFVSGLLLSAARYDDGALIKHQGAVLPSFPHIEMTLQMIRAAGVEVEVVDADPTNASWHVRPGPIEQGDVSIEPDLSNAAVFLAAAMVTCGSVTIAGWPTRTTQPGDQIREVFELMGGHCDLGPKGLTLSGAGVIRGIDIDLRAIGELTPTIAAVALFATGPSALRGIGHLRGHETDRLAALVNEIERLGGKAHASPDSLIIEPTALQAADLGSYQDHRMATFGAIVGLVVPGVRVENIATTGKTMPAFVEQWTDLVLPQVGRKPE